MPGSWCPIMNSVSGQLYASGQRRTRGFLVTYWNGCLRCYGTAFASIGA
jgi:hypothetical protein